VAALANIYSRIVDRSPVGEDPQTALAPGFAKLRPFANEDVLFFIKRIDNGGLVRQADPEARGSAWKLIAGVCAASVLVIGILLPGAYDLMAGYEIQKLRADVAKLRAEQSALDIQEAQLLTPARIEALAREQQFTDPAPHSVVFLDPKDPSAVAENRLDQADPASNAGVNAKR